MGMLQDSLQSVSLGGGGKPCTGRGKSPGFMGWYSTCAAEPAPVAGVMVIGKDALPIKFGS